MTVRQAFLEAVARVKWPDDDATVQISTTLDTESLRPKEYETLSPAYQAFIDDTRGQTWSVLAMIFDVTKGESLKSRQRAKLQRAQWLTGRITDYTIDGAYINCRLTGSGAGYLGFEEGEVLTAYENPTKSKEIG